MAAGALGLLLPVSLLAGPPLYPLLRSSIWCSGTAASVISRTACNGMPTGNLLLSILGMFNVQAERFGVSTGSLHNI